MLSYDKCLLFIMCCLFYINGLMPLFDEYILYVHKRFFVIFSFWNVIVILIAIRIILTKNELGSLFYYVWKSVMRLVLYFSYIFNKTHQWIHQTWSFLCEKLFKWKISVVDMVLFRCFFYSDLYIFCTFLIKEFFNFIY